MTMARRARPHALVLKSGEVVVVYPDTNPLRAERFMSIDAIPDPEYVIVTDSGMMHVRLDDLQRSRYRLEQDDDLGTLTPMARLELPPVPREFWSRSLNFFRHVYRRSGTEAMVLLFFDPTSDRYRMEAPEQWASAGSIRYEVPPAASPDELRCMSIHSHPMDHAEPSVMDLRDTRDFPGIHGVFGRILSVQVELQIYTVVHGRGFRQPLERWVGPAGAHPSDNSFPPDWLERVRERSSPRATPLFPIRSSLAVKHQNRSLTRRWP